MGHSKGTLSWTCMPKSNRRRRDPGMNEGTSGKRADRTMVYNNVEVKNACTCAWLHLFL